MHTPLQFPVFKGSYAMVAEPQPAGAIFFVHGFGGDALDTWQQFQTLLVASSAGRASSHSGKQASPIQNVKDARTSRPSFPFVTRGTDVAPLGSLSPGT